MQYIADLLEDRDVRLIAAEDQHGLFTLIRYGEKAAQEEMDRIQENPLVRWCRCFRNETGNKDTADAFFQELQRRKIQLPESCMFLTAEID